MELRPSSYCAKERRKEGREGGGKGGREGRREGGRKGRGKEGREGGRKEWKVGRLLHENGGVTMEQLRPENVVGHLVPRAALHGDAGEGYLYGTGSPGGKTGGRQSNPGNRGMSLTESQSELGWSQVISVSA